MKYVQIAHDYCGLYGVICASLLSPLAMAEWIEINLAPLACATPTSPLAMAEWIEISHPNHSRHSHQSPLAEWIEILSFASFQFALSVSPLAMAEWIEIYYN